MTDPSTTNASTASFQLNSNPRAALIELSARARGMAPSRMPAGHIYLQKNGFESPTSSITIIGNSTTKTANTKYFTYVSHPTFFVEIFLEGILYNSSWNHPKGQRKPHTTRPSMTPTKIAIPVI